MPAQQQAPDVGRKLDKNLNMQNENISIRQIEEPVEKAKRLIGLKQAAFKDYIAARLLFLNSQLHQAAFFANTCLEKEFKSCLYTLGVDVNIQHNTFKLLNLLSSVDKETFEKINPDFLKVLTKIYESRYHEGLNPGYNFVIIRRKFLAELDYTYQILERKVRFKLSGIDGNPPATTYELSLKNKLPTIILDNYLYNDISKEQFLQNKDDVFEFRMLFNHEVAEAYYTIPTNLDLVKFKYEALIPSNNGQSYTISHHINNNENLMVTRNGVVMSRKIE